MKILIQTLIMTYLLIICSCTTEKTFSEKEINIGIKAVIKGYDPIQANDTYGSVEISRIYEGLLEYHYLKRPFELRANLAEEMPKVSADGLTYTFKLRKGVVFQDDKAFPNNKGRELVAEDFVYSIKRLADPKLMSKGWWLLDDKLVGLNEWRQKHSELETVDYDEVVKGIRALDRYTLQFELKRPFPQFLYALAMPFCFVVAKEVVDFYGKDFQNHPIGTGAFKLSKFSAGANKVVYYKNPTFREMYYPKEAYSEFERLGHLKDAGKKLPLVDKISVSFMPTEQPRWLNFSKGNIDTLEIPKDNFNSVLNDQKELKSEYTSKGVKLEVAPSLDLTYIGFNFDKEIFKNKKLRQAIALAFDNKSHNKLFHNGVAQEANGIIPPGVSGFDSNFINKYLTFNIQKAKELLAQAGFPGGKGLPELTYDTSNSTTHRQQGEFFAKLLAQIGIKLRVFTNQFPVLQQKINDRKVDLFGIAWSADYPDAENFLQLLYGPNKSPGTNDTGYNNPTYNELYKKSAIMQNSPERTQIYEKLNQIMAEDVPIIPNVHRQFYIIKHKWLKNYIHSDFEFGRAKYLNVDLKEKAEIVPTL